jgi:SWI/SNF-related matrix-associated actin-dependent regulator 1 of chromatin subfamily A
MTDYKVKLQSVNDLEIFSKYIKDAVIRRIAEREKFSAIRLQNTPFAYTDWLHKSKLGDAHDFKGIRIADHGNGALDLAATVIHEMGHILVGAQAWHNEDWQDGTKALGLLEPQETMEKEVTAASFTPDILTAIEIALATLAKEHPEKVYNDDIVIPWPAHVGLWTCDDTDDDCHHGHKIHVMQFEDVGIKDMIRRIAKGEHILLGDDMGTGKTLEMIGVINYLLTSESKLLIACPNNAKLVWRNHLRDYCIHKYDVEVAYTSLYMFSDQVIMNYEAVALKWGASLAKQKWDMLIYDEGHKLKTPSAARSKACYGINARIQVITTGTPIVNYPYEIFPLIHYLDRKRWPEYGRFEMMFGSRSSEKLGRNLNRLNQMLRDTIMVRRLKKDVLKDLPQKRRSIIEIEVPDEVRPLIEEEKKLWNEITNGTSMEEVSALNAMRNEDIADTDTDWHAIILALQSTKSYPFTKMAAIAHKIGLAKLPFVIDHISDALESRDKVAVFGHHRDVLTRIAEAFNGHSVLLLGGNTNQAEVIEQAKDRFNNDENCTLFVGGITMAESFSLKGSSTCIFVEEDWVPGVHTQAEDRLHGIGRGDAEAKSMLIQHLVFEDSLDTKKAQLTVRKQKSIDRATR